MQPKSSKISVSRLIILAFTAILYLVHPYDGLAQTSMVREHQPIKRMVTERKLKQQIDILCDSSHAGRAAGEKGGGLTARWIQSEFERMGLLKFGSSYGHGVLLGNGRFGRNIIGMLPGSKHFSREKYIIVGAHYDHLGILEGKMYPGADANASGTVALLNIAEMLSAFRNTGRDHDYNVIFVAFDAKESNMAGSKRLWRMIQNGELVNPQSGARITKDKIAMMVNMDQLGCTISPLKSGRKDYIIMLGNDSLKPIKRDMLRICNRTYAIDMEIDYTYYGSKNFTQMFYRLSDQRIFVDNGIPSILFTSGITMNTNKTYDSPETIDTEILRKRIFLIYHWLDRML